jgi:nitrate reductase gamma subunit
LNLTAILWFVVAAGALVFAVDALLERVLRRATTPPRIKRTSTVFGILMLLFAFACALVGLYEALN